MRRSRKTRKYKRKRRYSTKIKGGGQQPTDETICKYVSPRGIMKSCSIYSTNPNSDDINTYDLSKINNNSTIYIKSSLLNDFFSTKLETIKNRFILVSGDSDTTVPDDITDFTKYIKSDKIIHWFAQNCTSDHPKISRIPIGLDYHTLSNKDYPEWGDQASPHEQEKKLIEIKDNSTLLDNRIIKCYSNFHFKMDGKKFTKDRQEAKDKISPDCIFYEPSHLKRYDSWEQQSKYAFVVSPHGNGLDCHRTWEALCLGCIVIVKKSPIDALYKDLPVLFINDWSEVTQELLDSTISDFTNKTFNYDKLTLKYWIKYIHSKKYY